MKNGISVLTILSSMLFVANSEAAGTIKAAVQKRTVKTNESFSVSYRLLTQSKRISPYAGSLSLFLYSDSSCSSQISQLGQAITLSNQNKSGTYSIESAGSFYIKPIVDGYTGDCLYVNVLDANVPFEKLSVVAGNPVSGKNPVTIRWENNSGALAASAAEVAKVEVFSNESCSIKAPRVRTLSVAPRNGLASVKITRSSSGSLYLKAVSSLKVSECVELPAVSCSQGTHAESGICVNDVKACSTALGSGTQTWNGASYGSCILSSCFDSSLYSVSNGSCSPISCSLSNANISNAASVSGTLVSGCLVDQCEANYTKNGNSCSPTECTTSDVPNSLSVLGNKVSGCSPSSCISGYKLKQIGQSSSYSCELNSAPIASNASISLSEDTSSNVTLSASDQDNDSLTYSVVSQPSHGSLSGSATNLTYTPDINYSGSDSFTFKANDLISDSNLATVSITVTPVNDAPISFNQSVSTDEDVAKSIILTASDVDSGSSLSYVVVSQPTNGTLSGSAPNLTYTPNLNYSGSDSFTFKANDGVIDSNMSTVVVSVNPINDAPVAVNDAIPTQFLSGSPILIPSSGLLLNDTDVDNSQQDLSLVEVSSSSVGSVSVSGSNVQIEGVPPLFNGPISFLYTISDGSLVSNQGTVSLSVSCPSGYSNSGGTCVANVLPPSNLSYSQGTTLEYTVGSAIVANQPVYQGGTPSSWSISPALPAGLSFNTLTGVISGTPTISSSATNYTITATNSAGSTTKAISIRVVNQVTTTLTLQPYDNNSNKILITFSEPVKLSSNYGSKIGNNYFNNFTTNSPDGINTFLSGGVDLNLNDGVFEFRMDLTTADMSQFLQLNTFYSQILLIPTVEKTGSIDTLLENVTFYLLEGFAVTSDGRLTGPASIGNVKVLDASW